MRDEIFHRHGALRGDKAAVRVQHARRFANAGSKAGSGS